MGLLVLMRHAKSDYPAGVPDHDRPLAPRGVREAPLMAPPLLAEVGDAGDAIALVSSATRAQQTWHLVESSMGLSVDSRTEPALYESDPAGIAACVRESGSRGPVIVVAHNPGIHEAVLGWTGEGPTRFPTSAFAVLECDETWPSFDTGRVRLRSFVVAR